MMRMSIGDDDGDCDADYDDDQVLKCNKSFFLLWGKCPTTLPSSGPPKNI